MPGFDRTGPAGIGPMTGWGRGLCSPYGVRAGRRASGPWPGRGGRGRGWRHRFWAAGVPRWGRDWSQGPYHAPLYSSEEEIASLRDQAGWLREELEAIEKRLRELEERSGGEAQ